MKRAYKSTKEYHTLLDEQVDELTSLQRLHYASNGYAVLVMFQGMDAAGKDGVIRQVMSGVNPQGCQVFSFKQPSAEELEHDFLWRTTRRLPERGRIGIFNRSYYEEVLIVRVHTSSSIASERCSSYDYPPFAARRSRAREIATLHPSRLKLDAGLRSQLLHRAPAAAMSWCDGCRDPG